MAFLTIELGEDFKQAINNAKFSLENFMHLIPDMIEEKKLRKRAQDSIAKTDSELLIEAKKIFSEREYVSVPGLQMALQLPFSRALKILNKMISDHFAAPHKGTLASLVLKKKN